MLATVTTEPRWPSRVPGCRSIWPITCFAVRYVPVRFTAMTRAHSSAGSMCTGPPPATPAAFTSPSMLPPKATAARTSSTTEPSSATSTWVKSHRPSPLPRRSPARREVGPHDAGPLRQQSGRRGPADARGGSRHDVGPAVQSTHGASVWLRPADPG